MISESFIWNSRNLFIISHLYVSRRDYVLKFDDQFEVHNDEEILKRMGLLLGIYFIVQIFLKISQFFNDFSCRAG